MARGWVLALALFHPEDVDHLDAFIQSDGAVNISWTLPADPSVVGLTIFRDRLDNGDTVRFELVGLTTSFVDSGASDDRDYRYWIHTRDAQGDLSDGVFVEVFDDHDHDHGHGYWTCSTTVATPDVAPGLALLAVLLAFAALRRVR